MGNSNLFGAPPTSGHRWTREDCYVARMLHDTPRRGPAKGTKRRSFGKLRKLPSGRYQAGYTGPDTAEHRAPATFQTKLDAEGWLAAERRLIDLDTWTPPRQRESERYTKGVTVAEYADRWILDHRRPNGDPIKPRTRAHYAKLLDQFVKPGLGALEVRKLTPESIEAWYFKLDPGTPTYRAHAYSVLRTMLESATRGSTPLLKVNPCQLSGAGTAKRKHKIEPASLTELEALTTAMPARLRLMVLLAAWCGLRWGEITELRRKDIAIRKQVLKIQRGVVRSDGKFIVGAPKSEAGAREVAVPPHLMTAIADHLAEHVSDTGPNALLFPAAGGGHLSQSTFHKQFNRARAEAGRPDLRFHDLRHTGAVLAAQTGATIAELMARLGHSTPGAAMRYQHAARGRDKEIATLLSKIAEGDLS